MDELNQNIAVAGTVETVAPHRKVYVILVAMLLASTLIASGLAFYFYKRQTPLPNNYPVTEMPPVVTAESGPELTSTQSQPKVKVEQLVFTKNPNRDDPNDYQAWSTNTKGTEAVQVPLGEFWTVFKYPDSPKLYYFGLGADSTLSVWDTSTNSKNQHTLITHPLPEVSEGVTINDLYQIAPDGSAMVFQTMFTKPCPSITIPPDFQGGFGPCTPDEDPNLPNGYYVYSVSQNARFYLGQFIQFARWSPDNQTLYYNNRDDQKVGLYRFNLKTKAADMIKKGDNMFSTAYPLFKTNQLIDFEAKTGDSPGNSSMSQLSLIDQQTGQVKVIDSGVFAQIQPFAIISPDESAFIYQKTENFGNGRVVSTLHLVDLNNPEPQVLTPMSKTDSYYIQGVWTDNQTFVTLVDTVEAENYHNDNNYLVRINTMTKEITRITPNDDVYRFITN